MANLNFRTLRKDEIDVRIATISASTITLLLYKDARVDQNILDETVGAMNWQRSHSRENANCTVSIWDDDKKQWISKEDTGTESYTEAAKGLASDSFKRACFNWGIGRELYTAPRIQLWLNTKDKDGNVVSTGVANVKEKNGKFNCYDEFVVTEITYNERKEIETLKIKNKTLAKMIVNWKRPAEA